MPFLSRRDPKNIDFSQWKVQARTEMPVRDAAVRRKDFAEVNKGFDRDAAVKEALRCLECGCHDYGECELIKFAQREPGLDPARFAGEKHPYYKEQRLVCIERDQGKCMSCNLCVRICEEEAGVGLLGLVGRGFTTVIKPEFNDPKAIEVCATCKKCAEVCPTGALKIIG